MVLILGGEILQDTDPRAIAHRAKQGSTGGSASTFRGHSSNSISSGGQSSIQTLRSSPRNGGGGRGNPASSSSSSSSSSALNNNNNSLRSGNPQTARNQELAQGGDGKAFFTLPNEGNIGKLPDVVLFGVLLKPEYCLAALFIAMYWGSNGLLVVAVMFGLFYYQKKQAKNGGQQRRSGNAGRGR
jgi:hypothetical protein